MTNKELIASIKFRIKFFQTYSTKLHREIIAALEKQEVAAHRRGVASKPASLEANGHAHRLPSVRRRGRQRPTRRSMKRRPLKEGFNAAGRILKGTRQYVREFAA
jgi:hypothetical protein